MGTNKETSTSRSRAQVQSYIRRLAGTNAQSSGGTKISGTSIGLPKGTSTSKSTSTPHSLPRQLEATAYTKTSTKSSGSSGSVLGNLWLISPLASSVKSLFNLFGGGSSSSQTIRYRSKNRTPFQLVESVSPETGGGTSTLNESAAGLTGVTNNVTASNGASSTSSGYLVRNPQDLVDALRRGLNESRGITDVLNEFEDGL